MVPSQMLLDANQIQKRLRDIKSLSTLPHVMMRVMTVIMSENSSAKDLAAEIRSDQAMTSKILKLANSAYYGFYRKIANIDDAVVLLGFKEIRSLCLAISVFDLFSNAGNDYFDRKQFWRHSMVTAVLAEMLAEPYSEAYSQAFTAGLLHDLGRVVLDQYFPDQWKEVCKAVAERKTHWLAVEQEFLGTHHAEIGFWLTERWDFPPALTESIRYHHEPAKADSASRLTGIVHLADILSRRDLSIPPPQETIPALDPGVYERVPLSRDKLDKLMKRFGERRDGIQSLIDTLAPA